MNCEFRDENPSRSLRKGIFGINLPFDKGREKKNKRWPPHLSEPEASTSRRPNLLPQRGEGVKMTKGGVRSE